LGFNRRKDYIVIQYELDAMIGLFRAQAKYISDAILSQKITDWQRHYLGFSYAC